MASNSRPTSDKFWSIDKLRYTGWPPKLPGTTDHRMTVRVWTLTATMSWATCLACNATTKNPIAAETSDAGACISGAIATACPTPAPTFSGDVLPLMNARCGKCHSHNNDAGLWPLDDWQTISDWQSTILDVLRNCSQPPPEAQPLTRTEREAIEGWIMCGAQNN